MQVIEMAAVALVDVVRVGRDRREVGARR